jgi:pimeloyl-ACP methyl ester carboxylesterase
LTGLVVFLHGLRGNEKSWGTVPNLVKSSLGNDFEVATPKYTATIWSPSKIETSSIMIKTLLATDHPDADPIFMIGHSLGGLIAREVCRYLLISGDEDLLNKIPAVITVGTPLEGARIGNLFLRNFPFLSSKIKQLAQPKYALDSYKQAIKAAEGRNIRRPQHFHFQMERDGVIAAHDNSKYTEDDVQAGVIPGDHRNFATDADDAAYVARVLLAQIRKSYVAISRPSIPRIEYIGGGSLPDRLILISCSHGKERGGKKFSGPPPAGWIPQETLRQRVISKRTYVYSLVRDAKLADGFQRGGNRAHQTANMSLRYGPDLGGTSVSNEDWLYMPASQRYNGRCYAQVTDKAWNAIPDLRGRVKVLIMSGLYGLIEPEEWIQDYDVHLTDTNEENGQSVSSMWTELFTESITSYIKQAYTGRKVHIFNLLCDHHYVDAVQWHALSRDCSIFHLASPTLGDTKLLPPAGAILNSFLLDPDRLDKLDRDHRKYPLSDFGEPPAGLAGTEIVFESRVGLSKKNAD